MPAIIATSTPVRVITSTPIARVVTAPYSYYNYGYYGYPYYSSTYSYSPYTYPLNYPQPTFYGTCASVSGVGVVRDNCLNGTTAVSVPGSDACYCYDRQTGWSGCANTANGVCLGPAGAPILYNPNL